MEKSHNCKICNKIYKNEGNLSRHMKTHETKTPKSNSTIENRLEKYEEINKKLIERIIILEGKLKTCEYLLKEPRQIIFNDMRVDNLEDLPENIKTIARPYVDNFSDTSSGI